jgi:hypothetical protein
MRMSKILILGLLLFVPCFVAGQERTAEEIIAGHLNSIGPKEKLSAVKNQMLLGDAQFTYKGSAQVIDGKILILSSPGKMLWGLNFSSNDYPQDRFAFDGSQVRVGYALPGRRSLLAQFLNDNRELLKDGLLGGTLSNSWLLLNTADNKAKFKVDGKKKIDGTELIVLECMLKGGSDVSIKLYFDAKNLRHVRSEHTVVRAAIQGPGVDNSAGQTGTIYRLVEEFSDFKKMNDLMLPSTYRITYSLSGAAAIVTGGRMNREAEWTFKFTNFGTNRELDAKSFDIEQ